ncbi:hypothetical protein B0T26DRAFT_733497 [Lasiosphaeria miniovina]|uniref:DUF8212 domain-containing protein n=1 Tax=Lasiosphaeria miniovina TaxID=1954250 RepID=A0AA39ZUX0_9PEZI|nr:uncharacterized protein B0T26DRAFT_733497 [Lasiosphaeria miniovina]KAK0703975.1 hypothetical protein B0T26DRAFT_733497 [Lasiosphaeria miniovina]
MYQWYADAIVCFAYLSDLKPSDLKTGGGRKKDQQRAAKDGGSVTSGANGDDGLTFEQRVQKYSHCRWFTRGWTLQELIAPRRLGFYDTDWGFQGEKSEMALELTAITGIRRDVLENKLAPSSVSVAQRMSWASRRETTRAEDMAYCLLGLFDVNMPLLYGEGSKAFIRLQGEIIKEICDFSLFAWRHPERESGEEGTGDKAPAQRQKQRHWGILALSPKDFADSSGIETLGDLMYNNECVPTSKGLRFVAPVNCGLLDGKGEFEGTYLMNLRCEERDARLPVAICLRKHGRGIYSRVNPTKLPRVRDRVKTKEEVFYVTAAVSPARSVMLAASHRHAINLSRLGENLGIRLDKLEPADHWDRQQLQFLTEGNGYILYEATFSTLLDFPAKRARLRMQFYFQPDMNLSVTLGAVSENDGDDAYFRAVEAYSYEESVEGQPVHFVILEPPRRRGDRMLVAPSSETSKSPLTYRPRPRSKGEEWLSPRAL